MLDDFLIGEDEILERVDEYTLYCFYLEFQPEIKVNYKSPLRDDDAHASFGIYPTSKTRSREYIWKDSGGIGESGDIFRLVQKLFDYPDRTEAVLRVKSDFSLGTKLEQKEKIIRFIAPPVEPCDFRIIPKAFTHADYVFWQQFYVTPEILHMYRVSPLYCYWSNPKQKAPVFAPSLSYVYRIFSRYQLYFPTRERDRRFRNDLFPHDVMGLEHLTFNGPLIITKSYKDIMCLRSFGYDAVSPKSENTPMPPGFFEWVDARYKDKFVLFDNDMKHRGEWYPYKKVYIPLSSGEKDPSDFTKRYGYTATKDMLQSILI
jgi:hypothetical protein